MMSTILKARYGPNKAAFFAQPATLTRVLNRLVHLERESQQAVRDKVQREPADLSGETGADGQDETAAPQQCKENNALSAMVDLFGDVYCQNSAGAGNNYDITRNIEKRFKLSSAFQNNSNSLCIALH